MSEIKKFLKELRRTRWPKGETIKIVFWKVIIFVVIFAIVLFVLSLGLTAMWKGLGVGL